MSAIYERELDSQLNGLTGYLYGAFMLLFAGVYVMAYNLGGYTEFTYVVFSMTCILVAAIPMLTMRSIAEERRQGTDKLLYSLPISMTRIVLGKYLALVTVMAMPMAVMCLYPPIISAVATSGVMPMKSAYGAMLGFFALGAALTAVGLFISSLMENVGLAAGACFGAMLLIYFLTPLTGYIASTATASLIGFTVAAALLGFVTWRMTGSGRLALILGGIGEAAALACFLIFRQSFGGLFAKALGMLAIFDRFDNLAYDIFDMTGLVYFASVAAVFLFLTVQVMERRRWA